MNNLNHYIADIGSFLKNVNFSGWQENVKIIFLVLAFLFLALAVYSYIKAHRIIKAHHHHQAAHGHDTSHHGTHQATEGHVGHEEDTSHADETASYAEAWSHVRRYAESLHEAEWKLSVIEGDKFVDDALKWKGFAGETMGERLMMIKPNELSSLQELWDAHKLRNILVHDTQFHVRHEQALAAVNAFERVLKELGALA